MRTFNIISFPSAGNEAIEYALSTVSGFFIFKGHRLNLSHSNLNLSGSPGCSSGCAEMSISSYLTSHFGISI